MRTLFLLGTVLLLASTLADAKIYKWTDSNGTVHFTDNIAAIPPAYRQQVEERGSTAPGLTSGQPGQEASSGPSATALPPASHRIPLHGEGNNLFVDATLNGSVTRRLQVDTGATYTVISRALARQLRLKLEQADIIPLTTANGTVLASLTRLASVTVGNTTVRDLDVIVHDAGGDGLLGMSFLSNFQVAINIRDREMTLTPMDDVQDTAAYGGRPERWWRWQFAFYRSTIDNIKAYLQERSIPATERTRLTNALQLFQQKLFALEHKATQAAVPRHWRY